MCARSIALSAPSAWCLGVALSLLSQTPAAADWTAGRPQTLERGQPRVILIVNDEAFSSCPPGTIFQKMNGNRGWCVKTSPDMYGGGQAKDTDVLVPEESTGPSPFGDQKPRASRPWKYY